MCAVDDCDPWTVSRLITPIARRPHRCIECGRTIHYGERYHRLTGMTSEGTWSSYATCAHCAAVGEWMAVMCDGYPITGLLGELVEHWRGGYRRVAFGRLIACMKLRWHDGRDPIPAGAGGLAESMLAEAVA